MKTAVGRSAASEFLRFTFFTFSSDSHCSHHKLFIMIYQLKEREKYIFTALNNSLSLSLSLCVSVSLSVCHVSGSGTLCASWQCLEVPRGPPPSLAVQFVGSGASLSGMDVELVGSRYRMSLVKKRFATGDDRMSGGGGALMTHQEKCFFVDYFTSTMYRDLHYDIHLKKMV